MRKIRIGAATVMVAAGLIGAVAIPAPAAEPSNYGQCVSTGFVHPSTGVAGPSNAQGYSASQGRGGSFITGITHSGGKARFAIAESCSL
jgi:hypothetical protein